MASHKRTSRERRTVAKAEWVARALKLDERGWSIRRIARQFGLHHSTVQEALRREYSEAKPTPEQVEAARERALERQQARLVRADKIIRTYAPLAAKGDIDAAKVVIEADSKIVEKALAAIARLEGTDAPARSEVSGPGGSPVTVGITTHDEILGVLAKLAAEGGEGAKDPEPDP